jgi:hypothetical protein
MLETGAVSTVSEIAAKEKINSSYVILADGVGLLLFLYVPHHGYRYFQDAGQVGSICDGLEELA